MDGETENIIRFTTKDLEHGMMKDLIKAQGTDTCRQEINIQYMKDAINNYDFGLARITQKANIGKKHTRRSGDRFQLWGFLLCRTDENSKIATIDLVCSRTNSKGTGKLLIEMMIEILKESEKVNLVRLLCLPKEKLKTFYIELGFRQSILLVPEPYMKFYEMIRKIRDE